MRVVLSVIIPCYNADKYIGKCLDSILPFLPATCELIIVDDGSTDDTLKEIKLKCDEHPDSLIKIIQQLNNGVSVARNRGIEESHGEYITFIDSDDCYDASFWDYFPSELDGAEYDLYEFNANYFESQIDSGKTIKITSFNEETTFHNLTDRMPAFRNSQWFPWARVYKAELFKKSALRFPVGMLYEDMALVPQAYLLANSVKPIKKNLIHYRINKEGISQTFRKKDALDLLTVMDGYKSIVEKSDNEKKAKELFFPAFKRAFDLLKILLIRHKHFNIDFKNILRLQSDLLFFSAGFPVRKRFKIYFFPIYYKLVLSFRKK
ncbi:glycosyltransferase family 2 protein [Pantoea vagans]|uniref:glycosyltransferase family 2 protein n=1 Tax=Pantoea vagans TaxID=470934 RepID=UPI000949A3BD|nr:glycosyltransferase [Pantoea vagans]